MIAEIGYCASSFAPARYSGSGEPGTLLMIRLSGASSPRVTAIRAVTRAARASSAGGMTWLASWSSVAGSALWRSLAEAIVRLMRSSRLRGSASSVGSSTTIVEIRLPNVPNCSGVRTETGTIVTSGSSGSSPCSIRNSRIADAHIVITTSLTVLPKAFLTALTSVSETLPQPTLRCGESAAWKRVRGARSLRPSSTPPSVRRGESTRPTTRVVEAIDRRAGYVAQRRQRVEVGERLRQVAQQPHRLARQAGEAAREHLELARRPLLRLALGRRHVAAARAARRAARRGSRRPDRPSTAEWWIFVITATRPRRRPWMT